MRWYTCLAGWPGGRVRTYKENIYHQMGDYRHIRIHPMLGTPGKSFSNSWTWRSNWSGLDNSRSSWGLVMPRAASFKFPFWLDGGQ